ncbi:hypothetical protein BH24ACT14_BH24ACT14_02640 [soil metagenome]
MCGQQLDTADHADCARLAAFDPPRYCGVCGFRLDVNVFPGGYRAVCRECRRRSRRQPATPATPSHSSAMTVSHPDQ